MREEALGSREEVDRPSGERKRKFRGTKEGPLRSELEIGHSNRNHADARNDERRDDRCALLQPTLPATVEETNDYVG